MTKDQLIGYCWIRSLIILKKDEIAKGRKEVLKIYKKKVEGKKSKTSGANVKHHGKKGHWLEKQMGVKHNADNKPDLLGFEMKDDTQAKTSFGDWKASYYIFWNEKFFPNISCKGGKIRQSEERKSKTEFLKIFSRKNTKTGLYSWSGTPCPKKVTDGVNDFGQKIVVNRDNSIDIKYSYSKDKRKNKSKIVPKKFRKKNLVIVKWDSDWLKDKVENKFSKLGWFKCMKDKKTKKYNSIVFGNPFRVSNFLKFVKSGDVYFDSGMKERRKKGPDRFRSVWRADNSFWEQRAVFKFP